MTTLALPSRPVGLTGIALTILLLATLGCGNTNAPAISPAAPTEPTTTTDEEHGHKPGAHGGIMVSLGEDSYHAEAVFEKGGVLRLYTLGEDESRVMDVEVQTLKGYVKASGANESLPFTLEAEPQDGDPAGRTSVFVGTLPTEVVGQALDVTIPNIVIADERFRLGFQSAPAAAHGDEMPPRVADDKERALYLEPGGIYTAADIAANGNMTATEKFKGIKSEHDMSPKPGDQICPITETKANAAFTWIVAGKPYEFCCPPCVDEFVKLAKTEPDKIKEPGEYVKP